MLNHAHQLLLERWYNANSAGCKERGCTLKIERDLNAYTVHVQHGPNPECVLVVAGNRDPFYVELDLTEWVRSVHAYEDAQQDPGPRTCLP